MSRILVIGGYGGFGARLSRRLAAAGHQVLTGGRSAERARAFAATVAQAEPVEVNRTGDIEGVLARMRPDLVIDAAGPFQRSSYRVPEACIAAGLPYLDLADARDFVCGIGGLDEAARGAGVAVVSGGSSVPALSGAVARDLAAGMDRVSAVEVAISASNQAGAGPAVTEAILSYVGQKVRLWRGGRPTNGTGWQEQKQVRFAVPGAAPIKRRRVALCDVPDHDLLVALLPERPAVTFRAGTELAFQMRALWLLSWLVRWGWVRSLRGLARWMRPLQRITASAGTDRSAMSVTLRGWRGDRPVARRWTLVAEQGDGPEIPTLAAALLAGDMVEERIAPGARDAASLLSLERFQPALDGLNVRHAVEELEVPAPLYVQVMGERFDALPSLVKAIHLVHADAGAAGEGEVWRGGGLRGWIVGLVVRFPPAGRYPLHVAFSEAGGVERWTRNFGPHTFSSELSARGEQLIERFGPLRFCFSLPSGGRGLAMELQSWSFVAMALPRRLAPKIDAREWEEDGRFRFDVRIALPLVGPLIHYSGWLRPID